MLNIRRSCNCLILNMGIPIPGKDSLYTERGSWACCNILRVFQIWESHDENKIVVRLLYLYHGNDNTGRQFLHIETAPRKVTPRTYKLHHVAELSWTFSFPSFMGEYLRSPENSGRTRSTPWLLMPWLLVLPCHQQPWYWLYRIYRTLSSTRKNINYLHHLSAEKFKKLPIFFHIFF